MPKRKTMRELILTENPMVADAITKRNTTRALTATGSHAARSFADPFTALALEHATAGNYRDLAAAVVLHAVEELKTDEPPVSGRSVPAYDFLISEWGLYLAEAGADIPASTMREKAKGWERDRRRAYQHGSDGAEMTAELEDEAGQMLEEELYAEWIGTKSEQKRFSRMKKTRKQERQRKELIHDLLGILTLMGGRDG